MKRIFFFCVFVVSALMVNAQYTKEELNQVLLMTTTTPLKKPDADDVAKLKVIFTKENAPLHRITLEKLKFCIETFGLQANLLPLRRLISENVAEMNEKHDVMRMFDEFMSLMPGTMAPPFTAKDADGKEYALSDFQGKVVVIDVWATWCHSCLEGLPEFAKIRNEYIERDDIRFLTISIDRNAKHAQWREKLNSLGLDNLLNLNTYTDGTSEFELLYQVQNIPRYIIVGKDGNLVTAYAEHPDKSLRAQIDKALKSTGDGIQFHNISLEEAKRMAAESGKMVFVDCYTKTCVPCKYMARNIFPLKACGDYFNPRYISIMKDVDEDDGPEIAKRYEVQMYPTYLVIASDGSLLVRAMGSTKDPGAFIDRIQGALDLSYMHTEFEQGRCDDAFLAKYLEMLHIHEPQKVLPVLDKTMGTWPVQKICQKSYWDMITSEVNTPDAAMFRRLLMDRDSCARLKGEDVVARYIMNVYKNNYRIFKNMGMDYETRIADLRLLEKNPAYDGACQLRLQMQLRLINTKKLTDRIDEVASVLDEASAKIPDESQRMLVVAELNGFNKAVLDSAQKHQLVSALERFATHLSDEKAPVIKAVMRKYE
ncbi:MAG: redoxin domain-containing protein [Bacteroidaceae bacterium]|nr:redoxin domain-containing protein [Bacteroidaceae bacterium]